MVKIAQKNLHSYEFSWILHFVTTELSELLSFDYLRKNDQLTKIGSSEQSNRMEAKWLRSS